MAEQRNVASLYDISLPFLDAVDFADMIDMNTSTPVRSHAGAPDWPWIAPPLAPGLAGGAAAAPAGQALDDVGIDDIPIGNLVMSLSQRLTAQWLEFKATCRPAPAAPGIATDERAFQDTDKFEYAGGVLQFNVEGLKINRLPAWYWIRTRPFWPDLSELMLFWLYAPVSTAGLERGFSFQTLIDQDTRRRLTTRDHMRDDMLAHVHRSWLSSYQAS